ncbi:hypothetical protein V8Z80_00010 [Orrella sp. JC864]|uniref:hypothetical protein n=1 Tax=Orrella sp. JC864 TaxID=3120298 RepID=UPI0012BCF04E
MSSQEIAWDVRARQDGRFYGYVTVSHSGGRGAATSTVQRCPDTRGTIEEAEADAQALAAKLRASQPG